jgi:hypothetical protein
MSDEASYDSRADTLDHIQLVRNYISVFIVEMLRRGERHDASKFTEAEKPTLDAVLPLLAKIAYGSAEYEALKARAKPALITTISTIPTTPSITGRKA